MKDHVRLKLLGISEIVGIEDISLLGLVDELNSRQLVVTCDKNMRKEIQMYMMKKPETAKRYPKVLCDVLKFYGYHQLEILISSIKDGEYGTEIVDPVTDKHFPIRCSDGILLSIAGDIPLYATSQLMLSQSVPFKLGESRIGLPLTVLSETMLQMSLKKAIETENYEMASNLRDELNKRHSKEGE